MIAKGIEEHGGGQGAITPGMSLRHCEKLECAPMVEPDRVNTILPALRTQCSLLRLPDVKIRIMDVRSPTDVDKLLKVEGEAQKIAIIPEIS